MRRTLLTAALAVAITPATLAEESFYGTLEPFVAEAVYFALTDRFADGDPANNYPEQGGQWRTFDRPLTHEDGTSGNIGYLGGDFKGLLDHADYIGEMGFTALWITPIVDNPNEAFSGGFEYGEAFFSDHGKTGYHGYWGVNFYELDEHLVSDGLDFKTLTRRLRDEHNLKLVLDIVGNHGSPSYTMPVQQPGFGQVFDAKGDLVADHQNLAPADLDPANPLHAFFHREPDVAELSNFDDTNPAVMDYLVGAYLKWIDEGAAAFRIDTIRHVPHAFWKTFTDRIRAEHPGFFMFGEAFDYEAANIAPHTFVENGGVSVLDFPCKQAMENVFTGVGASFAELPGCLHLDDRVYRNPYDLAIFYDNHDMPRVLATDLQYQDLNNWLFTSRGFPVVYYGSETGFMRGASEHKGNRNFFGADRIAAAREHPIRRHLTAVAQLRKQSIALQRGLQVNLQFEGDQAAFLRVYQHEGVNETALVLLNKADAPAPVKLGQPLAGDNWRELATGKAMSTAALESATVPAHGVRVFVNNDAITEPELLANLRSQMKALAKGNLPAQ